MNGAMAELCAMISNIAKMPRVIRMGVIHQRLLFQKKANNSPAIPKRCPVVRKKPILPPQLEYRRIATRASLADAVPGFGRPRLPPQRYPPHCSARLRIRIGSDTSIRAGLAGIGSSPQESLTRSTQRTKFIRLYLWKRHKPG